MQLQSSPVALVLTRQNLPTVDRSKYAAASGVAKGAYVLADAGGKPDVILLDISMPVLNGIDAAHQLRKILPSAKLIFVTMHADADFVTEAFRAGAAGYLARKMPSLRNIPYCSPSVEARAA